MPYYVQAYKSTDLNAPPLSGQAGSGPVVLNACLVDGYGFSAMPITGITRAAAVATATVSAANGLKLKTGMYVTIAGATGADAGLFNGTFAITVASATTFTYTMSGTPTGSATGVITCDNFLRITSITRGGTGNLTATVTTTQPNPTLVTGNWTTVSGCTGTGAAQFNTTAQITVLSTTSFSYQMASDPGADATGSPVYCKAGLQWTRPFPAGTNAQSYKSAATVGALGEPYTARPLQVVDNAGTAGLGKEMQIYCAEAMSADQAVTAPCPTVAQYANGLCLRKSSAASTANVGWTLAGDEKGFIFAPITGDSGNSAATMGFGYLIPAKSGDLYNTYIAGGTLFNSALTLTGLNWGLNCVGPLGYTVIANSLFLLRSFTQMGSAVTGQLMGYAPTSGGSNPETIGASGFLTVPNPVDSGYYAQSLFIQQAAGQLRGRMPGWYGPLNTNAFVLYDQLTGVVGLPGATLMAIPIHCSSGGQAANAGVALVDVFGPWT